MSERLSWDIINCAIVWIISLLATCLRLRVGALIWHPETKQIVAVGYNGAPSGQPHCIDTGCEMEDKHCVACLHGEDNVFYWAGTRSYGCYLYLNYSPCRRCVNKIIQGKIKRVVFTKYYGNSYYENHDRLRQAGITVTHIDHKRVLKKVLTALRTV